LRDATAPAIARRFPGTTIVCLAPGPTLTAEAVGLVLRAPRTPVIAINDAHRLAPWAEVLYSSDRRWWAYYDGVPSYGGQRVAVGTRVGDRAPVHVRSGVSVLVLEHTGQHGLDVDPRGLRTGGNSGYAAVNLAVHLGARRILLVGYTLGPVGGRSHFFGRHPAGLDESRAEHYADFRAAFATIVAPLAQLGIEVLNCTPGSHLDVFPHADLRTALAAVAPAVEAVPC